MITRTTKHTTRMKGSDSSIRIHVCTIRRKETLKSSLNSDDHDDLLPRC